jgi:hypothetical protein
MCERSAQQSELKLCHGCKGDCAGPTNFSEQYVIAKQDNKKMGDFI